MPPHSSSSSRPVFSLFYSLFVRDFCVLDEIVKFRCDASGHTLLTKESVCSVEVGGGGRLVALLTSIMSVSRGCFSLFIPVCLVPYLPIVFEFLLSALPIFPPVRFRRGTLHSVYFGKRSGWIWKGDRGRGNITGFLWFKEGLVVCIFDLLTLCI
jgi:hypothetical protein